MPRILDITKCLDQDLYREFSSWLNVLATYFYNQAIINSLNGSDNIPNPHDNHYMKALRIIPAQLRYRYGINDEKVINDVKHKLIAKAKEYGTYLGPFRETDITEKIFRIPEFETGPAR